MSSTKKTKKVLATPKTLKELRYFGLSMALILSLFSAFLFWKERPAAPYLSLLVFFFGSLGLLKPEMLRQIDLIWTKIGELLGSLVTPIVLSLLYFLVITPMGFLTKLMKKDLLSLKLDPNAKSYWIKVEADGPASRHYTPY
ncbi:MAG: hypothetical protein SGJ02_04885 [bacterium]|nr:hypothetical protein [bacterium]